MRSAKENTKSRQLTTCTTKYQRYRLVYRVILGGGGGTSSQWSGVQAQQGYQVLTGTRVPVQLALVGTHYSTPLTIYFDDPDRLKEDRPPLSINSISDSFVLPSFINR